MGKTLPPKEDEIIWYLRHFVKLSNKEIKEKFGYSNDGILHAIQRYNKKLEEDYGVELGDFEASDLKLFFESRAILHSVLTDKTNKDRMNIAKFLFKELNPFKRPKAGKNKPIKYLENEELKRLGASFNGPNKS